MSKKFIKSVPILLLLLYIVFGINSTYISDINEMRNVGQLNVIVNARVMKKMIIRTGLVNVQIENIKYLDSVEVNTEELEFYDEVIEPCSYLFSTYVYPFREAIFVYYIHP